MSSDGPAKFAEPGDGEGEVNSSRWSQVLYIALYLVSTYAAADEDLKLKVVWQTAKTCQGVARVFGRIGLRAENKFYALCEEGRMI